MTGIELTRSSGERNAVLAVLFIPPGQSQPPGCYQLRIEQDLEVLLGVFAEKVGRG